MGIVTIIVVLISIFVILFILGLVMPENKSGSEIKEEEEE
jgi:hypothetical protein